MSSRRKQQKNTLCCSPAVAVEGALGGGPAGWRAHGVPEQARFPERDWLLVFVGTDADAMRDAAAGAAAAGFERTAVLDGGLQAFGQAALQQVGLTHLRRPLCTPERLYHTSYHNVAPHAMGNTALPGSVLRSRTLHPLPPGLLLRCVRPADGGSTGGQWRH